MSSATTRPSTRPKTRPGGGGAAGGTVPRRRRATVLVLAGTVLAVALALTAVLALAGNPSGGTSPAGAAGADASAPAERVLGIRPADVVTTVAGEPVTGAEVLRAARALRAEVISEFTGRDLGPGFWERVQDGVTPAARLRERAVDAAALDKARRTWAREAGLLADVSERGFQRELAAENRRRAEAARAGRPVPGVPSYDEYTYAQVRAAELDSALSKLYAHGLDLSERRLREQYARAAVPGAPPFEQARENVRRQIVLQEYERALRARAATDPSEPRAAASPRPSGGP